MNSVEIVYRYAADDAAPRARPGDGDAARRRLDDGNRAFASLLDALVVTRTPVRRVVPIGSDLGLVSGDAPAQRPYAAVLGCSDARVPIELIFGEGPNDRSSCALRRRDAPPPALNREPQGTTVDHARQPGRRVRDRPWRAAAPVTRQWTSSSIRRPTSRSLRNPCCAGCSTASSSSCMRRRRDWPQRMAPR